MTLRSSARAHGPAFFHPPAPPQIDLTDTQWRDFRSNLPLLAGGALVFLALSQAVQRAAPTSPRVRLAFYATTSLVFLAYAAGAFALVILAFVLGNYALARASGRAAATPALVWAYTLAVLIASEWYHDSVTFGNLLGPAFAPLDAYRGIYGWHRGLNLVALRMISFSLDRYWALGAAAAAGVGAATRTVPAEYEQRVTTPLPDPAAYDFVAYIAYIFYIPLHIAGPILPANAFLWQVYTPPAPTPVRTLLWQSVRLVFALALMEWMLHYLWAYAVATSGAYRGLFGPLEIGVLGYFSLHLIWLKFLIIWRFFRIWALADNIETVENMNRCMSNNYSLQVREERAERGRREHGPRVAMPRVANRLGRLLVVCIGRVFHVLRRAVGPACSHTLPPPPPPAPPPPWSTHLSQGFWRSWHRSFNRWLIRYIYIPIGGKRRRVLSTFLVFTFTAVWHDLQLKLLAWGWLIAVFIIPETVAGMYFNQPKLAGALRAPSPCCHALADSGHAALPPSSAAGLRAHWSYRHLAALGGALDILFMMIVNLVGFSVGLDGIREYLTTAFLSSESAWFLLGTIITFFSASQLMFAVRANEARRNIHKEF